MQDRHLIYITAFLRAFTTALVGVILGLYLVRIGIHGAAFGGIVTAGLSGVALTAVAATFLANAFGRRRFLLLLSVVSALGTGAFLVSSHPVVLAAGALLGMLNGMGRDRGAALIIEQATLPSTTSPRDRTRVIAWYTMLQDLGHACGSLLAGLPVWLGQRGGVSDVAPHRMLLVGCAGIGLVGAGLYWRLGDWFDENPARTSLSVSPATRRMLARICSLFAIDSLAGGFLTTAMLSYFFFERFGVSEGVIGLLFFLARLLNAISHLGAAWLSKRIGLVNTMVFTHIPSSVLLMTVAFAPSFSVAAGLFLLREGLVEMDVPTRQSYVLAVVAPEERTLTSGVTHLVRLACWAVAPTFAGLLMIGKSLVVPLMIGASMKIGYDLLLWRAFRKEVPPEEA